MTQQSIGSAIGTIVSLGLMTGILMGAGCAHQTYSFQQPLALKPPPINVTVEQISNDYKLDPVGADAKYLGKKLLFDNVVVDSIHITFFGGNIYVTTLDYFTAGNVSFQLLDYKVAQQYVQAGYILRLEGVCRGILEGGFIRVNDCWYQCIQGDMGTTQTRIGGY